MDKQEMLTALKQAQGFIGARAKMAGVGDGNMLLLSWFKALELAIHELSMDAVPVVRCKNCKHRNTTGKYPVCELDSANPYELTRYAEDDDWYCADGVRRDGDA